MTKINEIFISLQGESSLAGYLTIFIRFSGCNLRCNFCDTQYHQEGTLLSLEEILHQIDTVGGDCKRICITGGEPLLQKHGFIELAEALLAKGYDISVETNGTYLIIAELRIKWILDYKLKGAKAEMPFYHKNFKLMDERDELKFVITNRADYNEAMEVISINHTNAQIIFSPTPKMRKKLAKWMVEDKLNRVRYGLQIHKIIFAAKRGV